MPFETDQALKITEGFGTHECYLYRQRIFAAHEFLSLALARQYVRTAKALGYVKANLELGKFHKALTLGRRFQGLFIDSPDDDIKRFSQQRSLEITGLFSHYMKQSGLTKALGKVITKIEECDLTFPLNKPKQASKEEIAAAIARCGDPDWWRRQIRNRQDTVLEQVHIELGLVNKQKGIYASNQCVSRKQSQWHRNEQVLAGLEAENDLGQVFNLLDLAQRGVSNLINRRNELMTRLSGFEGTAKARGHVGVFITLTAPSRYHSFTAKPCRPNPKYEGFSPADTQSYFNTVWKRIRAKLHRLSIQPYGFRVVEPHHDATPHWHLLLFLPQEQVKQLVKVTREYALAESPNEAGAQTKRVKVEYIDSKKGTAVGYIAKYIAKNIDGENIEADLYGRDAVESATRIRAWASNWNIRQFQAIGGPSVTAWREARQFANGDLAEQILENIGDDHLKALINAADSGNWQAFTELSGGPTAARNSQPLRAMYIVKDKPNKYGEAANKILGLIFHGMKAIKTRLREWTVRPVAPKKVSDFHNEGFSVGGANAPPLEFCQ